MATRWGVVSAGKISHDFCAAVGSEPQEEHQLVAVAARKLEDAKKFAALHKIAKAYGSYEELAKDSDVEVVYIGAINPTHLPMAKLMLENGKHLLVEKPLAMNSKEVDEMLKLAAAKKLFLMEAVWSRFLPTYQFLMKQIKEGAIGEVMHVQSSFGFAGTHVDRMSKKSLGGGTLLDIGIYCLNLAQFVFGDQKPEKILAVGQLNEEGVDESITASMLYKNGKTASFSTSSRVQLPNEGFVVGTKGTIKIPSPFWCSETIFVKDAKHQFPFPPTTTDCNFLNSSGLRYEAREVRRCLKSGLLESDTMSQERSRLLHALLDEFRKQIGVVYDQD